MPAEDTERHEYERVKDINHDKTQHVISTNHKDRKMNDYDEQWKKNINYQG